MSDHDILNTPQTHDNSKSNQSKHAPFQISSHPTEIIQKIKMCPQSMTHADVMILQRTIGNQAVFHLMSEIRFANSNTTPVQTEALHEEEEVLQGKFDTIQREKEVEEEPLQINKQNITILPDNLKAGLENLSGVSMDDRIHYNSVKPVQVGALAYTQGTDIHVAPGQEKHLTHKVWHVVQQKQEKVQPAFQLNEVAMNGDVRLDREAAELENMPVQFIKVNNAYLSLECNVNKPETVIQRIEAHRVEYLENKKVETDEHGHVLSLETPIDISFGTEEHALYFASERSEAQLTGLRTVHWEMDDDWWEAACYHSYKGKKPTKDKVNDWLKKIIDNKCKEMTPSDGKDLSTDTKKKAPHFDKAWDTILNKAIKKGTGRVEDTENELKAAKTERKLKIEKNALKRYQNDLGKKDAELIGIAWDKNDQSTKYEMTEKQAKLANMEWQLE